MTQSQKELLDLQGKIAIEYDWEQEEVLELKAAEERMLACILDNHLHVALA
jgi:hypothetical protein